MTPQEVIETLEIAKAEVEWRHPIDCAVAIDEAIKAVEKQIPKSVTTKKLNEPVTIGRATFGKGTNILARCPSCGGWVNRHHRYCPECGQAVYLEVEE